jgi:hypothetical protein
MRLHVDVLGWLHLVWGAFGALSGASLWVVAAGGRAAMVDLGSLGVAEQAALWLCVICGTLLVLFGAANLTVGRSLQRRRRAGRVGALLLGVPNLVVVPFGTALGVYAYWVLLNDDARHQFGRPPRLGDPHPLPTERA